MSAGGLDPALHSPVRLQIVAMLARVEEAEFATVRDIVEVSDSVLSKQLSALADAKLVKLRKAPLNGRQRTWVTLTRDGRVRLAGHLKALRALVDQAEEAIAAE